MTLQESLKTLLMPTLMPYRDLKRPQIEIDPQLSADLTFENCVEGDFNRTARSAGYEIAQKPGQTAYNPLW